MNIPGKVTGFTLETCREHELSVIKIQYEKSFDKDFL